MQRAPAGALCAIHPGVAATTTCRRCGNFMCSTCAEFGHQPLCPTCLALTGAEFPLTGESDFSAMWGHCVEAWKRELAMLSVAALIFFGMSFAGGMVSSVITQVLSAIVGVSAEGGAEALVGIVGVTLFGQLIGTLVSTVVQGVALVGLYRVLMDVLAGQKADLGRMFSQLHLLPRYIVLQLIFLVAIGVPVLGTLAGGAVLLLARAGIAWRSLGFRDLDRLLGPELFAFGAFFFLLVFVAAIVLLPVTVFSVPELIVGQCSPVEAITRAWSLGSGQRLRVIGYGLVSGAVVLVGMLACFIGLIPALPLSYMLILALYLGLRRSSSLPPAPTTP